MARAKKRSDGRYQTRIAIGNGKYKFVSAYSQKELDQKVAEVKMQSGRGIDVAAELHFRNVRKLYGPANAARAVALACVQAQSVHSRAARHRRGFP